MRWLLTLLFLTAAALAQSSQPPASSNAPGGQSAQPSATQQRGTDESPLTVKILPTQKSEAETRQDEQERREKAETDRKLAVETQRIADYTFWLGVFTLAVFCAAIGQIVLFWIQLYLIRESLTDAKKAAEAAKESADATAQIARSERAWMIFNKLHSAAFQNATIDGVTGVHSGIMFNLEWINAGRSPANQLTAYSAIGPYQMDATAPRFEADWTSAVNSMPIGQGRDMKSSSLPIIGEHLERFWQRQIKIFIYGAVRYFDVYEPTMQRVSEICIEVVFDGHQTDPQGRHIPNWRIMPVGPQNTIS